VARRRSTTTSSRTRRCSRRKTPSGFGAWVEDYQQAWFKQNVDKYNKSQTKVQVNLQVVPVDTFAQKLKAAQAAGMYSLIAGFGYIRPGPLIAAEIVGTGGVAASTVTGTALTMQTPTISASGPFFMSSFLPPHDTAPFAAA